MAEAPVEKPGRRQKLLGWLRGDTVGGAGAPHQYLGDPEECLQISTNLTLHLLEQGFLVANSHNSKNDENQPETLPAPPSAHLRALR